MSSSPMKLPLFEAAGAAPFCVVSDAGASTLTVGDFHVAGMDFKVTNASDIEHVLGVALEGLVNLQRHSAEIHVNWLFGVGNVDVSTWSNEVKATVRCDRTSGIIEITQRSDVIEVNLPDATLWEPHGLAWLLRYQDCCARNEANREPWFGPCCGCTAYG